MPDASVTSNVVNFFIQNRASAIDASALSALFDQMIWIVEDNGEQILKVLQSFLDEDDHFRVSVALGLKEVFLFKSRSDMVKSFDRLCTKWPDLAVQCALIVDRWDKDVGDLLP